jgi:hypothetical protein
MAPRPRAVLARHPVLARHRVLAGCWQLARHKRLAVVRMLTDADALADPDGTRAKHTSQFAGTRHVHSFAGAQREVLVIVGQVADLVANAAMNLARRCLSWHWTGIKASRLVAAGRREPIVWVRPGCSLLGIITRRADALSELGELVPATLADGGKRHRVPGQVQCDLVRLAGPIAAAHCLDGQHGTINAAQRPHNGTLTSRCPKATPPAPQVHSSGRHGA